jgi:very-short-patch-repair endonuclease
MNKLEFIIRQISRTNKKNYENYVVTRIYHLLQKTDLKFQTQQYVRLPGRRALTDMYFPQLGIHVEVDEIHHEKQIDHDLKREIDIVNATEHQIRRIKISDDIEEVNHQIDALVSDLKNQIAKKVESSNWESWDIDKEFNPNYYREKGYLDVDEGPAFRKIVDACNCLGQGYSGNVQKAWYKSKDYANHYLWFPKFYENDNWDNRISDDSLTIIERCKVKNNYENWYNSVITKSPRRITFPRRIDNLGFRLYKFAGIFETDVESSSFENGVIHRLVGKRLEIRKRT